MNIDAATFRTLNTGFSSVFQRGFKGVEPLYSRLAMIVNSKSRDEAFGWLRDLPGFREWLGDRFIYGLEAEGFTIENRKFEMTVRVQRTDIEDDRIGTYAPMFENMGRRSAQHPDKLLASLIASGFNTNCWDGQFFFDTDHPVGPQGALQSVANTQGGAGAAWYLLDLSQAIRPFIYQERVPYTMTSLTAEGDENVFMRDEYLYGVRARCNVGFGAWQLAYASKQTLNADNYEAARAAMNGFKDDQGSPLGIVPTHLLVPVSLEGAARKLVKSGTSELGESNPWVGSAELIVSPWLS